MQSTLSLRQSATRAVRQLQRVTPASSGYLPVYRAPAAAPRHLDVFSPAADVAQQADAAARLSSEAVASFGQYQATRDAAVLSRAIALQRDALAAAGPVASSSQLALMGSLLTARYSLTRNADNLERSIELKQRAVDLTPAADSERASRLGNLAASYGLRFQARRNAADLSRAVELQEQALELTPAAHPLRLTRLEALASALLAKPADAAVVDRGISLVEEALPLAVEAVKQAKLLALLADFLGARARVAPPPHADLRKAVELAEEAVRLSPAAHVDHPARLATLAGLLRQAWVAGTYTDRPMIQRAVALDREAKRLRVARP